MIYLNPEILEVETSYFLESKQVQTRRCKANDKGLIDDGEGEKMLNNQYLSANSENSHRVAKIRITPSSPGIKCFHKSFKTNIKIHKKNQLKINFQ